MTRPLWLPPAVPEPKDHVGLWFWHIHHEPLVEEARHPMRDRLLAIRRKPLPQIPLRVRSMRLVKDQFVIERLMERHEKAVARSFIQATAQRQVRAIENAIKALHAKECRGCPWTDDAEYWGDGLNGNLFSGHWRKTHKSRPLTPSEKARLKESMA